MSPNVIWGLPHGEDGFGGGWSRGQISRIGGFDQECSTVSRWGV